MTINNTPSAGTQQIVQQHWNDINAVMMEWKKLAGELAILTQRERAYRMAIYELKFPTCEEGTNRIELGQGYNLKCVAKYNYTLANKENETEKALDEIEAMGEAGKLIAERLVSWSPDIKISEYRLLSPEHKAIIDKVLTIKPGMPTLEIEVPKAT